MISKNFAQPKQGVQDAEHDVQQDLSCWQLLRDKSHSTFHNVEQDAFSC
jgi:hypothetical protein